MSVRPKFNRSPADETAAKTADTAAPERADFAAPKVSNARGARVLVLHSNRQNSQDFKTLGISWL